MSKQKFKGFEFENGKVVSVAYFDGYHFGDRQLEGVPFKAEVKEDGALTVSFVNPKDDYEKTLKQSYWLEHALDYAKQADFFCELANLRGEDLILLPA